MRRCFGIHDGLLALALLAGLSACAPTEADRIAARQGWLTHVEPRYAAAIQYPAGWHLRPHALAGRHRGLDQFLVTSFEVPPDTGIEGEPPAGEVALHVAFEANDLPPGQPLRQFVYEKLASIFYAP